jgi:hypothetical protein
MLIHMKIEQNLLVEHLIADETFGCDRLFEYSGYRAVEGFFRVSGGRSSEHDKMFVILSNKMSKIYKSKNS